MERKNHLFLLALMVGCLGLTYFVNVFYKVDIVYSHLFYVPIVLCGLWYPDKAFYLAILLGMWHIGADYYASRTVSLAPRVRAGVFLFVGYLVGTICEKRDCLLNQMKTINSVMLDFICEVKQDGSFGYVSPSVKNTLGYEAHELTGKTFLDRVHPDDKASVKQVFEQALNNKTEFRVDYRYQAAEGSYKWMESLAKPILAKGEIAMVVLGSREITTRKKMEEELTFLSFHDSLTGLYNRRFFEEQMTLLDGGRSNPVSVISCDIDGLKIINDHFGHQHGDEMIVTVSRVLQEAVRSDDIVARIGGDEFAIIMPRCPANGVDRIYLRIKEALGRVNLKLNGMDVPIMVSMGRAVRNGREVSIRVLFKTADDEMYLEKQSNAGLKQSLYSRIVDRMDGG